MSNTSSSSGGLGLVGALTVLFVALKLLGVIGWSWWWVVSPIWISFILVVVALVVGLFIYLLVEWKKG